MKAFPNAFQWPHHRRVHGPGADHYNVIGLPLSVAGLSVLWDMSATGFTTSSVGHMGRCVTLGRIIDTC